MKDHTENISKMEALFMPAFVEMDLLNEFARQIKFKETPHTFVSFYMELLRSPDAHAERQAATYFLVYLRGRSWLEILEMFARYLAPEDVKIFSEEPGAEKFFSDFALMAQQQVQDYWEQFMEERKNAPKQILNPEEFPSPVPQPDPARGSAAEAAIEEIVQKVVQEIKKMMNEGEDWKGGPDSDDSK